MILLDTIMRLSSKNVWRILERALDNSNWQKGMRRHSLLSKRPTIYIMGAWKKGPLAAPVVCPAFRGRTEVQIPKDEKKEREVAKATVERIDLPVAHKMQRL
jgi:hypothetical protein